jgi:hypothetical protein
MIGDNNIENLNDIDRLEKHNQTYVGARDKGSTRDQFGPDEIDLLVEANRLEREEREREEKYFRFVPPPRREDFSLAESFLDHAPILFSSKVLTKLCDQDRVVFSRVCKRTRRFIKNEFGETKYTKMCVRKFASSKEGVAYAMRCGAPKTEKTFASIARLGIVEAMGFALDYGWPHDTKAATACARGNHFAALRWLRANGLSWNKKEVLVAAMENRNVDMAEWVMLQEAEEEEKEEEEEEVKDN